MSRAEQSRAEQIGLSSCVALDTEDYIAKAIQLGTDPASMTCKPCEIMMLEKKIKPISRLFPPCERCALPTIACICGRIQTMTTDSKFLILTSEREFSRASSTGRLFQLSNPTATEIFIWERKKPPLELLKQINRQTYLLFPAISADLQQRVSKSPPAPDSQFIVLDGTWNEAQKILHKSAYLNTLPLISIEQKLPSAYTLRAGNLAGTACTIEAIIALLQMLGETESAKVVAENFELFLKAYQAGKSGHALKD